MNKTVTPRKPANVKPEPAAKVKPRARAPLQGSKKAITKLPEKNFRRSLLLIGWWKLRKWSQGRASLLSPILSISLALVIGWFVMQDQFAQAFGYFRTLVGGKQEAGRVTLAHQVYAAYRRHDSAQLQKLVNRAEGYNKAIEEAAEVFDIDPNLLQGVAVTESSFLPRDSKDGGHGLFQITLVPKVVMEQAARHLKVAKPSLLNPRDNAFIAAATLKYYLDEMNKDLFLGLLAYNIGPANGGLRFIMKQYGVTDFVTILPSVVARRQAVTLPCPEYIGLTGDNCNDGKTFGQIRPLLKNNDLYADKAYQLSDAKITESAQELGMLTPIIKEKRRDCENQTTPALY